MERGKNWKTKQKELEAWRYWTATAEYAFELGQVSAVEICTPTARPNLGWRKIDRATEDLRALLGIGGRAWEPLPAIEVKRRNTRAPSANGRSNRRSFVTVE